MYMTTYMDLVLGLMGNDYQDGRVTSIMIILMILFCR